MKLYRRLLAEYLISRKEGDHAMAAALAENISTLLLSKGNKAEYGQWLQVYEKHYQKASWQGNFWLIMEVRGRPKLSRY
jgi:hypothetical protein